MSKALRTVGMVVGAVALVAATAGLAAPAVAATATTAASAGGVLGISAATLTAIGTYGTLAAGALSMAAQATAPGFSAEGSATTFTTNPQSGLPYAIGRTRMSGLRVYARTYDGFKQQSKDDCLAFVVMLSIAGPVHGIEKFTADNEVVTFDGVDSAIGRFDGYMSQRVSLGPSSGPALNMTFGNKKFPDWGANHKLSGIAHAQWGLRFDTDGELYGAGPPEPAWTGKWVKVYDPRKDSTYPGGSGSHRALDESTYEWSDNPGLHALTWALGRWQNGKRVCGIGAPVSTIRIAEFVENANICEANGWKAGGVEWTTDSKWDTLKRILQAGGAIPTQTGAMIGCLTSAPRTAVATIESRQLLDGLDFSSTKSRRDRFNTVIPRYVDEDSDWAVISGTAIQEPAYVAQDGGQRTKEIDFPLVQVFSGETATQPGQLAAYAIVNSREAGPFTWTTGPEWIGLKTGDVILLNVPEEGLVNQPVLITRRAPDPATGKVSFAGETETYSKHAYALGQSTTPPAPFSLSAPALKPAAPLAANWTVSGATSGEGFPALLVTGTSEMPSADAVLIDYRKSGDEAWISSAILSAIGPVSHTIAPLESETAYDVRIGYRVGAIDGNFTVFVNVTTGLGKVTVIEGQVAEQASAVQHHTEQINAALDEIQGLVDTYGTTASAAASAALAEAAKVAAESAKVATIDARDDASGFASAAQGSASIAHDAEVAAAASAGLAAAYQEQADTYAQQASDSAVAASDRAAAASTSAALAAQYSTGGGNLLTNTEFAIDANSWIFYSAGGGNYFSYGRDNTVADWIPTGEHVLGISQAGSTPGTRALWYQDVQCEAGKWYESSAWVAAHRCEGRVFIEFYSQDYATYLGTAQSAESSSVAGGRDINLWKRLHVKMKAPAGAMWARFFVDKTDSTASPDSYMWFTRPQLRETYQAAPGPAQFSHGGNRNNLIALKANIDTNAQVIANATDAISVIRQQVTAGNPNLLLNGGFENGTANWGWNYGPWLNSGQWAGWGAHLFNDANTPDNDYAIIESSRFSVEAGNAYTLAGDLRYSLNGTGRAYLEVKWWDAGGNFISFSTGPSLNNSFNFDSSGARRRALTYSMVAPPNAATASVCCVFYKLNGVVTQRAARQLKFERGTVATPYSQEAQVSNTTAAAIDAFNRTRAYWQVSAAVPGQRAQLSVWADNAGAGVDIVGNVAIGGNLLVSGSVNGWALADLAVQTAKLAANAATVPFTAYTEAAISGSEGNWMDVQSMVVPTTGALVDIISAGTIRYPSTSAGIVPVKTRMRILRNGIVIREQPEMMGMRIPSDTTYGAGTIALSDNPGAGSQTYVVQVRTESMSPNVSQRYLRIVELKK